jgi:hypothetical protein
MMSQQSTSYPPYDAYAARPQGNTLGIAGFICSLLGLLTGGHLLSPIGLILSIVGLAYRPRGWAIAGLILGLLGTCGWLIVAIVVIVAGLGVLLAMAGIFVFSQAERFEITTDMAKIAMLAEDYKKENRDIPPADLSVLNLQVSTLTDPWGNRYRYELTEKEPGFEIVSDGQDGKAGTADDIHLSKLDKYWEGAGKDFEKQLKEFDERSKDGRRMKIIVQSDDERDSDDAAATQPDDDRP